MVRDLIYGNKHLGIYRQMVCYTQTEITKTAEVSEEIPIKAGVGLFVFRRIKTDEIYNK